MTLLGGNPRVEVLTTQRLTTESADGLCVFSGPAVASLNQSVKDILRVDLGDVLRVCRDASTGQEVGCNVPHEAELIYRGPEDVDCRIVFQEYSGRGIDRFSTRLELQKSSASEVQCWAKVRVSNQLTSSLRNIGDKALPLGDP